MAYFPNGSSSLALAEQCVECHVPDDAPCPVLMVHHTHNYDQCDNPKLKEAMNRLIDEKGKCLMKPILDELRYEEPGKPNFRPPMVGDPL